MVFKTKQFKTLLDSEKKDTTIFFRKVGKCSLDTQNNIPEDLNLCVTDNTRCLALEHAADDNCSTTRVRVLRTTTNSFTTDQKQFY